VRGDAKLLAFGLGTFHAVILTLTLVLSLYLAADLGEALDSLNTGIGLAVFGALWATSVYCTDRAHRDAGLKLGRALSVAGILRNGEIWGAWNGVLFFWCLLVGGTVAVFISEVDDGLVAKPRALFVAIFGFGVGTVVSAIFGAAVGFVIATVDMTLQWAGRSVAGVSSSE
jgi:hypothetical protein